MVRQLLSALLLVATLDARAAQITARLDAKESRLGEPVMLQVEARGKNLSLDELELAALATDFEMFNVTRSSENDRARLEATLYPLRAGALTVPAIAVNGIRSKPLALTVNEDPDLSLSASFAPDAIHERQRSILLIAVRDKADRQWAPPARLEALGLLLRPLGERQFEEGAGPERVSVRELRWEVLGLKGDRYALKLPMLDAYQLGRRLRVPLPIAPLEVRALPSYLPVAVPVGKPGFTMELPAREGKVGQAMLWVLRVSAPGFTPDAARALLRLPSNERKPGEQKNERNGLRFYPPNFHEEEATEHGPRALRIEIPFVPTAAGEAKVPALSLPYFDPRSQRMEQVTVDATAIKISDPFWKRVAWSAAGIAAIILAGFVLRAGRRLWHAQRAQRAALARVTQALTAQDLAHAVCAFSKTPHPHTLRQWLAISPNRQALRPLVDDLEQACFSARADHDLHAMKQRWVAALNRRPLS